MVVPSSHEPLAFYLDEAMSRVFSEDTHMGGGRGQGDQLDWGCQLEAALAG